MGTAKGDPTSILGRGLSASASMGESKSGFSEGSGRPVLVLLSVILLTPQSSKSGRLSSSSPARSMWLPGVFGLSMATALTRSTSASMLCLISNEGVSGGGWGTRCGGRSLVITGDRSARRWLVLDSLEGDFFDEETEDELRFWFWERFRRERLGVVAETGEFAAAIGAGSITMGGTSLRGVLASEAFRGRGFASFDEADALDNAGDGVLFVDAEVLGTAGAGGGGLEDASFAGAPLSLEPRPSGCGELGPAAALFPARPPPRPPRPPPLPGLPRAIPRKADPGSPPRPHPCLLGAWFAHIDEPTPPEGVDGDVAEAI